MSNIVDCINCSNVRKEFIFFYKYKILNTHEILFKYHTRNSQLPGRTLWGWKNSLGSLIFNLYVYTCRNDLLDMSLHHFCKRYELPQNINANTLVVAKVISSWESLWPKLGVFGIFVRGCIIQTMFQQFLTHQMTRKKYLDRTKFVILIQSGYIYMKRSTYYVHFDNIWIGAEQKHFSSEKIILTSKWVLTKIAYSTLPEKKKKNIRIHWNENWDANIKKNCLDALFHFICKIINNLVVKARKFSSVETKLLIFIPIQR